MNKQQVKALIYCATTFLIIGCSTKYDVSTNLDSDNINHYFSAANVDIFDKEQDITGKYNVVGVVEGQDCQEKPHHAQPNEVNARTMARQQAYYKEANAIVFTGCAHLNRSQLQQNDSDTKQCHALVICYGKAYQVDSTKTDKKVNNTADIKG